MTGPIHGRGREEDDRPQILLLDVTGWPPQFANRIDHRGKHQAPGFTYTGQPDGTLVVTTPSGITVVSDPPPF